MHLVRTRRRLDHSAPAPGDELVLAGGRNLESRRHRAGDQQVHDVGAAVAAGRVAIVGLHGAAAPSPERIAVDDQRVERPRLSTTRQDIGSTPPTVLIGGHRQHQFHDRIGLTAVDLHAVHGGGLGRGHCREVLVERCCDEVMTLPLTGHSAHRPPRQVGLAE
jgi:hypothetical protein